MKMLSQVEGLSIAALVETGGLAQDTLVSITGDRQVDKAAANGFAIGRLIVPAKEDDTEGTVETRFKEKVEMEADGIVAAGNWVKLGALSPTDGKHTAKVWVEDTDALTRLYGIAFIGAADEGTVTVLTF